MLHLIVLTLLHSYKRIIIKKKKKVKHKQINQIRNTPIQRIKKIYIILNYTLHYTIRSHAHMSHRHRHKAQVTSV